MSNVTPGGLWVTTLNFANYLPSSRVVESRSRPWVGSPPPMGSGIGYAGPVAVSRLGECPAHAGNGDGRCRLGARRLCCGKMPVAERRPGVRRRGARDGHFPGGHADDHWEPLRNRARLPLRLHAAGAAVLHVALPQAQRAYGPAPAELFGSHGPRRRSQRGDRRFRQHQAPHARPRRARLPGHRRALRGGDRRAIAAARRVGGRRLGGHSPAGRTRWSTGTLPVPASTSGRRRASTSTFEGAASRRARTRFRRCCN